MAYLHGSLPCGLPCSHRCSQSILLTNCLPLYCLSASARQKDRRCSTSRSLQVSHNSPAHDRGALHVRCAATDFNATAKLDLDNDQPSIASRKDEIMELPPLIPSMAIAGLPPLVRASAYEDETEKQLREIAKRWQIVSFEFSIPHTISFCSFVYGRTVSLERFVAISYIVALGLMLDDVFFDSLDDSLLEDFGIDGTVRESPTKIGAFLKHLHVSFQREVPLENPTPIEAMMWESGQQLRRLSNPEWFTAFSDALLEFLQASIASETEYIAGNHRTLQDVETYTQMRVRNSGGFWNVLLQEVALDVFLHRKIRLHPTFQQLLDAAVIHMTLVNDIFSYPKEAVEEPGNPRNVIKVMVEFEGLGLPQAAWRTVELINANARTVMKLEKQLLVWEEEPWAHGVRAWVAVVKEMMSGNLYWESVTKRYRHPESVFPELRDCSTAVD